MIYASDSEFVVDDYLNAKGNVSITYLSGRTTLKQTTQL